jgi:AIPR protein
MAILQKNLEDAFAKHSRRFGGLKEDYFALLYIMEEFGLSAEKAYQKVAFGGNDYGIDAFHVDSDRHNLFLYQFKWSKSHAQFEGSFKRLIQEGIERVFGNPKQDPTQNQVIVNLKSSLLENQDVINKVFIHFVFNGDPEAAEKSPLLDSLREDLEGKKYLIDKFFEGRAVQLVFQYISNDSKRKAPPAHTKTTHSYEIEFFDPTTISTGSGVQMHVGFMKLHELFSIFEKMQTRLFEKNIRYGLSAELPPNRSIRRSLKEILEGKESPEVFAFNHNGITLNAEGLQVSDSHAIITEPRILNGAQTITSYAKFHEMYKDHPDMKRQQCPIDEIRVLAKVITTAPKEFVTTVTICNNRQNPVKPWNLHASDEIQLKFQEKFTSDFDRGIYYQRQEEAFENLTDEDLESLGVSLEHRKAIDIKRLAMTFLAVQGEVGNMSGLGEVFESDQLYSNTFRESYLRSDARKIVLCYKIQFRLGRIIREILERGYQKYEFLGRARNLIWALLIQGILNDPKLENFCEWYGETLTDELDYSDILKRLASKKIRMIIRELLKNKDFADLVAEEKYGFLRRKSTFQTCMQIAGRRFAWQKKSL